MDEEQSQLSKGHNLENQEKNSQPNDTSEEGTNEKENTSATDREDAESASVERQAKTGIETATETGTEKTTDMKETEAETIAENKETAELETKTAQLLNEKEKDVVCKDGKSESGEETCQTETEQTADDGGEQSSEETASSAVKKETSATPTEETPPSPTEETPPSPTEETSPPPSNGTSPAPSKETSPPSSKPKSCDKEKQERKADLPRARTMPKSYGAPTRKDIAAKFGGVATSGVRVQRSTSCGASAVKNMLLEWCRAKTRNRQGVDIQNFSSSWSDGLAFCALILAFFPDEFDFDSLDPKNRRENFQLAFNAAERMADCPPLLDVEDMVRMKVPDSKCVYTYVQELYRSLVSKGLVKTKKA